MFGKLIFHPPHFTGVREMAVKGMLPNQNPVIPHWQVWVQAWFRKATIGSRRTVTSRYQRIPQLYALILQQITVKCCTEVLKKSASQGQDEERYSWTAHEKKGVGVLLKYKIQAHSVTVEAKRIQWELSLHSQKSFPQQRRWQLCLDQIPSGKYCVELQMWHFEKAIIKTEPVQRWTAWMVKEQKSVSMRTD